MIIIKFLVIWLFVYVLLLIPIAFIGSILSSSSSNERKIKSEPETKGDVPMEDLRNRPKPSPPEKFIR